MQEVEVGWMIGRLVLDPSEEITALAVNDMVLRVYFKNDGRNLYIYMLATLLCIEGAREGTTGLVIYK